MELAAAVIAVEAIAPVDAYQSEHRHIEPYADTCRVIELERLEVLCRAPRVAALKEAKRINGHSSTLINIGTGSQISVLSDQIISHRLLDCRPYLNGNYLLVGASLCGGRAYKILRDFFQSVIRMAGAQVPENLYAFMDAQAGMYTDTELRVDSRFSGTRIDPSLRGSIQNISDRNLTAGSLSFATLNGICTELYEFYQSVPENLRANDVLIGSGNGIRNSSVEREIIRKIFSRKLVIPKCSEEAAYGAALMAMYNSGKHSMEEIRNMISYEAEQD